MPRVEVAEIWDDIRYYMGVHILGENPDKIIEPRRPREGKEELDYRISVYEPITRPIITEALDNLSAIFNEQNYSIDGSTELKEYILNNNFERFDFMTFIHQHILEFMLLDPNGIIVVSPVNNNKKIPNNISELISENEALKPGVSLVPSKFVYQKSSEFVIFLHPYERSLIINTNREEEFDGDVYYMYTGYGILKACQYGEKKDELFEIKTYYYSENENEFMDNNDIPVITCGGKWNEELGVYESFFNGFVPYGNEAIRLYSDLQAIRTKCVFPIMEVAAVPCTDNKCIDGVYRSGETCNTCHGTGQLPVNPLSNIIRPTNESDLGGSLNSINHKDLPPVRFFHPDPSIIELMEKTVEKQLKLAKDSLSLNYVEQAQSGTAKIIDREGQYTLRMKISLNMFDNIIFKCLCFMESYLKQIDINNRYKPQITKPTQFHIRTEKELLLEYATLKERGVSNILIKKLAEEIIEKRYPGDRRAKQINKFFLATDPLYTYDSGEIVDMIATGVASEDDYRYNLYGDGILDVLLTEDRNFLENKSIFDAKMELISMINKYYPKESSIKLMPVNYEKFQKDMQEPNQVRQQLIKSIEE